MKIHVRTATLGDAPEYHRLLCEIDRERVERTFTEEELQRDSTNHLADMEWYLSGDNRTIFLAEIEGKIVGYATVLGGTYEVDSRTAIIVIEVSPDHRRMSVGTALMASIVDFASECNIHRIELSVLSDNEAALRLYRKFDFEVEGIRKDARWIGGRYRDELWMSRILYSESIQHLGI